MSSRGRRRIVLVTDLNFPSDDFQALALLLAMPDIEIALIVATDGNTWAEEVEENVRAVLAAYAGPSIPVVAIPATHRHRGRGRAYRAYRRGHKTFLGPYFKSMAPRSPAGPAADGASQIERFASLVHGGVTLVSLGPMAPIADLLRAFPGCAGGIARIVAMAGWFDVEPGDRRADFNVWFDPHAAEAVFRSGVPILLLPRDACRAGRVDVPTLERIDRSTRMGRDFAADVVGMLAQHGPDFPLIDTIVPLLLACPDVVQSSRRGFVHVRRRPLAFSGRTYFRADDAGTVTLIREIDPAALRRCLIRVSAGWGRGAPAGGPEPGPEPFSTGVRLRQRLREAPLTGLRLAAADPVAGVGAAGRPSRRPGAGSVRTAVSALTGDGLLQALRDCSAVLDRAEADAPGAVGTRESRGPWARWAREADLLARVLRLDALATWTEADRVTGFAGLTVLTPLRRCELEGRSTARFPAGGALIEVFGVSPGPGGLGTSDVAAALHGALAEWWRADCERRNTMGSCWPTPAARGFAAPFFGRRA